MSLALIMFTATGVLAAFFLKTHTAQIERLQGLLGRALTVEARTSTLGISRTAPGVRWWTVSERGAVRERSPEAGAIDPEGIALARTAREEAAPVLQAGLPWEPIRFAAPLEKSAVVAVARLPAAVSPRSVLALLLVDGIVFTVFGAYLLRRQITLPLIRLGAAARRVGEGEFDIRLPLDGVVEVADAAWAFNEMSEALERRTGALEKAVSELRQANQSVRRARVGLDRSERLASVGRLAAGVAHEVGNPMGALLAFLDLVRREEGLSREGLEYLERAAGEGQRVRTILRQLLDFSRPPRAARVPVDLPRVVSQTIGLIRAQKRYAEIDFRVAEKEAPEVIADESMVAQILLNLLLNAADAVSGVPNPIIEVTTRVAPLLLRPGDDEIESHRRSDPGAVECEVADNGPGVSAEDRERIFDPFYTSKPPGEGTGLGLANAMSLAIELRGSLECRGGGGLGGACLVLRLPVAPSSESTSPRVRED